MMSREKHDPDQSFENQDERQRTENLIEEDRYDQIADRFQQAQAISLQAGNKFLADILAAAKQICLACDQSKAEAAWHRWASESASQRETVLKQQLYSLLSLVNGEVVTQLSEAPQRSLWQSLQKLLRPGPHAKFERHISSFDPQSILPDQEGASSAELVIYCLGPFRAFYKNHLICNWSSLKSQAIFKYLVNHGRSPVTKEILMELFWPDAETEAARRNLHQAIYKLRQALRREKADRNAILFDKDCYVLNPELKIWVDCLDFERYSQTGRSLHADGHLAEAVTNYLRADRLYQGDFLEEDLYEDWTGLPREHFRSLYMDLVDRLSDYYHQQGDSSSAIEFCQKLLAKDNCHEKAHQRLMKCYQSQGQRLNVMRQYQFCVKSLKQELDVAPSAETRALLEEIIKN
jgi:DNA-binding SARP family transcriptional activator